MPYLAKVPGVAEYYPTDGCYFDKDLRKMFTGIRLFII